MTANTKEETDVLIHNITWELFENLLAELGETQSSQITSDYEDLDNLAVLSPLEKAEKNKAS
ncbi:MAG TPA: hypothetical protein DCM38_10550 [Gammaproteobacteria bacterium]|nr:hypothetical protein [Gammaproteobacteria bacterium]